MQASGYRAFLSYSHADKVWANWLHKRLERYRPAKVLLRELRSRGHSAPERLQPIFKDRDELPSAADLSAMVDAALADSDALIVVCSPNAVASPWVAKEIIRFKQIHPARPVLAFIIHGEPNATDPPSQCFPKPLLHKVNSDGSLSDEVVEPVAADARPSADGRHNAMLKIVAGLLGVGFDAIRRRDTQRRIRQLTMISIASSAGLVLTTALALIAIEARDEAEAQRVIAEDAAATAQRTSDFLIEIFQIADPANSRGKEITAVEILDRGMSRIDALSSKPVVQSNLLHTMGVAYTGLGFYDRAANLLRSADALRASHNPDVRPDTLVSLAEVLTLSGDLAQSEALLRQALAILPTQTWSSIHSQAYNALGDTLLRQGDLGGGEASYLHAVKHDRMTDGDAAGAPTRPTPAQLADSERGLAGALLEQGRFDEAETLFLSAVEGFIQAYGDDHPAVAITYNNLAALYYFQERWDQVRRYYDLALPRYQTLFGEAHPEVANVLNNYGRLELENGNIQAARRMLERSVAIDTSLGRAQHPDLVFSLNSLGLARFANLDAEGAISAFNQAMSLVSERHRLAGPVRVNLAAVHCAGGDRDSTNALLNEAMPLLREHYAPQDWRFDVALSIRAFCARNTDAALSSAQALANKRGADNYFARAAYARVESLRGADA
ncbi:MAG: toll/interleukin-1 receptor domain-containing protein [Pseudomonadota bacterium]